jgi:hypothetical protein
VSLLVEAATGHGSFTGNILIMGLGLMLLILSAVVLIVGIRYWRLSQPSSEDANNWMRSAVFEPGWDRDTGRDYGTPALHLPHWCGVGQRRAGNESLIPGTARILVE